MVVMKFGGSSVANGERIRRIFDIVSAASAPLVVVSAMGDTTDHLLEAAEEALRGGRVSITKIEELHRQAIAELSLGPQAGEELHSLFAELHSLLTGISLLRELTGRTRDYLVSFGERLSARIVAASFRACGLDARALDGWEAGIVSDSNFGSAEILRESWQRVPVALAPLLAAGITPVVTGFIAKDPDGNITTLGRGGSDLSATFIAAACSASEVQIWKDVDGILTADPRLVKTAQPVEEVTYEEAAELAYFGAQVLHPRAMQPCQKTGSPVIVKNSYNPSAPGTRILGRLGKKAGPVRALTTKRNVTLVDIVSTRMLGQYGFLEEVFAAFARLRLSVDMVATSEVSISLTLDSAADLTPLKKALSQLAKVDIRTSKAIVTIVGNVRRSSEILAQAFGVCAGLGVQVQMLSQGASKVNISFIVNDREADKTLAALHQAFFSIEKR